MDEGINPDLYANGLKCEWMGVKTADMTREKLIEFIGQLDAFHTGWVEGIRERYINAEGFTKPETTYRIGDTVGN